MEKIVLEKRELTGKKCKKLLREGIVPCVIYNSKSESTNCEIQRGDAERLLQGVTSATILDVHLGEKKMKAFVKDIETDPRKDSIRHISFFEIDEKAELTFDMPLLLVGVSPAVKNNLGVLIQPTYSVTVKAKAKDVVPHIEIDISNLENIGDAIVLEEVKIPEGIELFNPEDINNTVATITDLQKQVEEEVEETEEEEEEGEVIDGEAETIEGEQKPSEENTEQQSEEKKE